MLKSRTFKWVNNKGQNQSLTINYTLYFNENKELTSVVNQHGYCIEKNSEAWDYFSNNH